jgi:hypothetical protein
MPEPVMPTSEITITPQQIHILIHSLGLSEDTAVPYRNYYCAAPEDRSLDPLVEAGLMVRGRSGEEWGGQYYHVTEAGKAIAQQHRPRRVETRRQRTYRNYLMVKDAFQQLTFREFVMVPQWKEARERR